MPQANQRDLNNHAGSQTGTEQKSSRQDGFASPAGRGGWGRRLCVNWQRRLTGHPLGHFTADPDLTRQLGASLLRIQATQGLRSRAQLSGRRHQAGVITLVDLKTEACQQLVIEQEPSHLAIGLADYGRVAVEIDDRIQASPDRDGLLYALVPAELLRLRFLSPTAQWQHLSIERQALEQTCSTLGITTPDWQALRANLRIDAILLATLLKQLRHETRASTVPTETGRDPSNTPIPNTHTTSVGRAENKASATEQMILLHLASLLHSQTRPSVPQEAQLPERSGNQRSHQQVEQALNYFSQRLDQRISLQDLSDHCGISARRMQAAFRQCLDKTPLQVLQELRLQQLRRHLLTGLSVGEACQRVGLRLSGHIASAYQKQYGELPRQTLAAINCSAPQRASSETAP